MLKCWNHSTTTRNYAVTYYKTLEQAPWHPGGLHRASDGGGRGNSGWGQQRGGDNRGVNSGGVLNL